MADDDVQTTIARGLRAAVSGELSRWTLSERRLLREAVECAADRDFVRCVEKVLQDKLEAVLVEQRKPSWQRRKEPT